MIRDDRRMQHNFVFSPFSLATALTILRLGACQKTATDIDTFLQLPAALSAANSFGWKKLIVDAILRYRSASINDEGNAFELATTIAIRPDELVDRYLENDIFTKYAGRMFQGNYDDGDDWLRICTNVREWFDESCDGAINDIIPASDRRQPASVSVITMNGACMKVRWSVPPALRNEQRS